MRVFRPTWTTRGKDKKGKPKKTVHKSPRYHISFKDHNETLRRIAAYTDRSASEALGRKLQRLVAYRSVHEPLDADLGKWVDDLTTELRDKLVEWDILDKRTTKATRPLTEHIEAWYDSIIAKGRTDKHATHVRHQVERIIRECGFTRYTDIDALTIEQFFVDQKLRAENRNHHVKAVRHFCGWMVKHKRAAGSPVMDLETVNAEADRQYERRSLTADELQWLIMATESGSVYQTTTGTERAMIYAVAVCTGLRANEIRTLARAAFDLDSKQPTVTVDAKNSKHRRKDVLPLTPELVGRLDRHLAAKLPNARAFNVPAKTAKMLRRDIDAARQRWIEESNVPANRKKRIDSDFLAYRDARGKVCDFHSLRMTFITNLARGGVHPKVAQTLARHSSIELTMNTYTQIGEDERREGIAALPKLNLVRGA